MDILLFIYLLIIFIYLFIIIFTYRDSHRNGISETHISLHVFNAHVLFIIIIIIKEQAQRCDNVHGIVYQLYLLYECLVKFLYILYTISHNVLNKIYISLESIIRYPCISELSHL